MKGDKHVYNYLEKEVWWSLFFSVFLFFHFIYVLDSNAPILNDIKYQWQFFVHPPSPPNEGKSGGGRTAGLGGIRDDVQCLSYSCSACVGPHGQPGCGSKFYFLGCEVGLLVSAPATESKETVLCERVLKSLQHKANVGQWYKTSLQSHMELHANCEWCWAKRRAGEGHWVIYPSPENYRGHCRKHTNQ